MPSASMPKSSIILIIRFDFATVDVLKHPQETLMPLKAVIESSMIKKTSIRFIVSPDAFTLKPKIKKAPAANSIHGITTAIIFIRFGGVSL